MSTTKTRDPSERRNFIRIDTVFPVEFCFINKENKSTLSEWMQGYTNNFSKGGICIEAHNISSQTLVLLQSAGASLNIIITVPFSHRKTEAQVAIRWFEESASDKGTYLIGVEYQKVDPAALGAIMGYVYKKKIIFPSIIGVGIAVSILALLLGYHGMELSKGKSLLEREAAEVSQQLHAVREQFKQTVEERRDLERSLMALRKEFRSTKEEKAEMAEVMVVQEEWLDKMDATLKELQDEKDNLTAQLSRLHDRVQTDGAGTDLQIPYNKIEALRRWVRTRQDPESGLIKISLQGADQAASGGTVFISQQAYVLQSFALFGEFKEADKLLEALKGMLQQRRGLFFDGYTMPEGKPLLDNTDSLSNMTLGIAILQYAQSSGDSKYSSMVEAMADELIRWQKKGGEEGIPFFENEPGAFFPVNLTGYVFFNMLYEVTNDSKYEVARDKAYEVILSTLSEALKAPYGEMAFLTIGPKGIEAAGIDPIAAENLIEKSSFVEEEVIDSEGKPLVLKGVSFGFEDGPQTVSSLRTSQMALVCDIMRGYYLARQMQDKAEDYNIKRHMYLKTLSDMIIMVGDDPEESLGYLPDFYSSDFSQMMGKGVDISSLSSISAVTSTIFAYYSYNPSVLGLSKESRDF